MLKWIVISICLGLSLSFCFAQQPPFKYRIAILGNPIQPSVPYNTHELARLKDLGFNALQLNIAWGARPGDEPLNLEDILYVPGKGKGNQKRIAERLAEIKKRARLAKKTGFRTIFHFGAPNVDSLYRILTPELIDKATAINSIQRPEIVDKYKALLERLHEEIPEIDDIQLYTFDQEAWIGSEFGENKFDKEIPLHERIPSFIHSLTDTWARLNPEGILWWEPWELSAGQIYACLPQLPSKNFGFFLHANIAEVQLTRPVDVWFRNMVNVLSERNIPVVGEIFMSSANEEVEPLRYISAPRLVFEELEAMHNVPKLSGVKEYFGLVLDAYDPCLQMASAKLKNPDLQLETALQQLAAPYGKEAKNMLLAWEYVARGLQFFPWDCTWRFRVLPESLAGISVFHQWEKAEIHGAVAPSPSWKSTRRSLFMVTEEERLDPWFYEDIELRAQSSANYLKAALAYYAHVAAGSTGSTRAQAIKAQQDVAVLEQTIRAIQCYCREVNLTFLMRKYAKANNAIPDNLLKRFREIILEDIDNQKKGYVINKEKNKTAEEVLQAFNKDPSRWVQENLRE